MNNQDREWEHVANVIAVLVFAAGVVGLLVRCAG